MTRLILLLIAGCAVDSGPATTDATDRRSSPFSEAFAHTNGRSCASCHVLADHGVLTPDHVAEADPGDPLFARIDADDPTAATPQFEHLAHGLVRVTLNLPARMDVIDSAGTVITRANRTLDVWRGVPTIENVAITAPYQLDGRIGNLRDQAQAAISSHAQGPLEPIALLDDIARFEKAQVSSPRAAFVVALAELGVPLAEIPIPERALRLTAAQSRGRDVFDRACSHCHGAATTNTIVDRTVHDALFPQLAADGTVVYDIVDGKPVVRTVPRPHDEFLNIGFALLSGYGQIGALPMANADVELPRYRFRFYSDDARTIPLVDLPPIPRDAEGNPVQPPNLSTPVDARGAPIVGPSLAPEWFSSDPGRAIVTGDPEDFEAFDIPQLRGIAHTAPYMHDNSHATLGDVVDSYSRFVLPFLPIGMPLQYQDSPTSPFGESLTLDEKHDLVAYLNVL